MRVVTLPALALLAATALPSTADAAFRCGLRPERCSIVYTELAYILESEARDAYLFRDMLDYPRKVMVVKRSSERLRKVVNTLDLDTGSELVRLIACEAFERVAALEGRASNDKRCADQF